jgi:thiamine pyrophosphokinase
LKAKPLTKLSSLGSRRAILLGPLAHGDRVLVRALREVAPREGKDLLIGVDRGTEVWLKHRLRPGLAVGDWDSLEDRRKLRELPHVTLEREKDHSDLAYALRAAATAGVTEILCLGLTGGRPDHHLAMMQELANLAERPGTRLKRVWAWGPEASYEFLTRRIPRWKARLPKGHTVSVLPLGERARGVTIRGMRYALNGARLESGSRGLSNEGTGGAAEVRLSSGRLVVIIPFETPYGQ